MPVTPFHFGPGLLLHAVAPRRVSFLAFCATNVLIDVESLVNLLRGNDPVHAFFHTYVGATLAAAGASALGWTAVRSGRRIGLPNLFGWLDLALPAIVAGALLGAWSHVALDSVMHSDIRPWAPFSAANPMLRLVPLGWLHLGCVAAGALGLMVLGWRHARPRNP